MYPDYKFTPAPKGSSRKAKAKSGLDGTSSDKIRELRETYARIAGPAVARSKKQKTAKNQSKLAVDIPFQHCILFSEKDSSSSSSSSSSSASQPSDLATPSLPPLFPQTPYPHLSNDYPVSLRDQKLQLSATFPRCPDSTSGLPAQTSYEARPTGCGLDVDMNKNHIFSPESVLYDNTMNIDPVSYLVNVQPLMPALGEGQLEHNNTSTGFDAFTDINLAKNYTSPLASTGTGDSQAAALNSDLQMSMQSWYPIPNANFDFPNWSSAPGGDHWQSDCVVDMKWSR
ncbi:hypothetical protein K435DRAFT_772077 [Dendrothele bispora CBS 962.96]|uniref:Uncharacterized protein n=1 Tax=Dendrothele bispora (strain CBS 962.96) TaxID=1314807 RepID=A0A4S8N0M5_DENBC|nr:hypothetical protein K435DRAFT_772077 [Dendrothele bispora CBS 962.96]